MCDKGRYCQLRVLSKEESATSALNGPRQLLLICCRESDSLSTPLSSGRNSCQSGVPLLWNTRLATIRSDPNPLAATERLLECAILLFPYCPSRQFVCTQFNFRLSVLTFRPFRPFRPGVEDALLQPAARLGGRSFLVLPRVRPPLQG